VVILSNEDLLSESMLDDYRRWARLVVMTRAEKGCQIFRGESSWTVEAPEVILSDPTGAGDIFAAAFLIRFRDNNGDALDAAAQATRMASLSVTHNDLDAKIDSIAEATVRSSS